MSLSLSWAKERLAVAAAEQEDKAVQVLAQLVDVIGGMADEFFQRCGEAAGVVCQVIFDDSVPADAWQDP